MEILSADAGFTASWSVQLVDADGDPITTYDGSQALAAQLWRGDDQELLGSPTVAWLDFSAGTLTLTAPAALTAALDPATYRIRVTLTDGPDTIVAYDAALELAASPGTATAPATYGTYQDLLDHAPWLGQLQALSSQQAGFAEARARARTWLEDLIHARFRSGGSLTLLGSLAGGPWPWGYRRGGPRSPWLVDQLAADRLLITDKIREAVARKAVAMVCESQIGPNNKDSQYQRLAMRYHAQASALALTTTAELDLNGDGKGEVAIDLSAIDVLRS